MIKNDVYVNEEVDPKLLIQQLKLQIKVTALSLCLPQLELQELKEENSLLKGQKVAVRSLSSEVCACRLLQFTLLRCRSVIVASSW